MTTNIDEDLDTDLFTVLDFDYEIPCDVGNYQGDCDNPAEWKIVASCCGRVIFYCADHFNRILDLLANGKRFWDRPNEGGCGQMYIVQPFSSAERIKG